MGKAVIAANTSIKVNGAVSASATADGTLYTAPANGYAIVNIMVTGSTTGNTEILFLIDSKYAAAARYSPSVGMFFEGQYREASLPGSRANMTSIYVGPGQALTVDFNSGGTGTITAYVTGVEFINSP